MAATKSKSRSKATGGKRKRASSSKTRLATATGAVGPDGGKTVVHVDDTNRRNDKDPVVGRPAVLTGGDHSGVQGYIYEVSTYGSDGFPDEVSFRPRDVPTVLWNEKYSNIDALGPGYTNLDVDIPDDDKKKK
jgi:hypothetical protein